MFHTHGIEESVENSSYSIAISRDAKIHEQKDGLGSFIECPRTSSELRAANRKCIAKADVVKDVQATAAIAVSVRILIGVGIPEADIVEDVQGS